MNLQANAGGDAASGDVDGAGGDAQFPGDLADLPSQDRSLPEGLPGGLAEFGPNLIRAPLEQVPLILPAPILLIRCRGGVRLLFQDTPEVRISGAVRLAGHSSSHSAQGVAGDGVQP